MIPIPAPAAMAATERTPISHQPEEILRELHKFVAGASSASKVSSDSVAQSALFLLQTLPAARHAVLEHLSHLFSDAVNHHVLMLELDRDMAETDEAEDSKLNDVQSVLMTFVKNNPEAWAPIISAWSIELLGQVSSKYSERRGVPHSSSLNELLQLWMTCQPTKILIDIASQCFAAMVGNAPDICVDALLEASVKHSPHFDWVVAHIGSCFPTTIITRVLMCGLKDFSQHGANGGDGGTSMANQKVPKMASVVGILGHLASRHGNDIRKALLVLFKDSLKGTKSELDLNVVPFLLHLASMSPMLLQVIATDFITAVTPGILNQLAHQLSAKQSSMKQDTNSLINLTVHLITKCHTGTYRVLQFLLDVASPAPIADDAMETNEEVLPVVQQTACKILDKLVSDLDRLSQVWSGPGSNQIPCLVALRGEIARLCQDLIQASGERHKWLGTIVRSVASQSGQPCSADVLAQLLRAEQKVHHLNTFLHVCECVENKYPDVLPSAVEQALRAMASLPSQQRVNILGNLRHLLLWQRQQHTVICSLLPCLWPQLDLLAEELRADEATAMAALDLLIIMGGPPHQFLVVLPVLSSGLIGLFFNALHLKDAAQKVRLCAGCRQYLEALVECPATRRPVLRIILESTLSQEHAATLGSKVAPTSISGDKEKNQTSDLLENNKKHAMSVVVPRMHSTVFHAGVIGQGLKPPPRPSSFTKDEQLQNQHLLLELLRSCSSQPEGGSEVRVISETIGRHLSLLLIELVAPDVMYNGLPWPEEDFMKVTVERDLLIRNMFDDNPILWDILELVATSPGALCYCSSLLRGVCATLMDFWEACREKKACNEPKILNTSCRLIRCMRQGLFIPAPLGYIDELFAQLKPYEVFLLLLGVWKFMKEKPPIPDPRENELRACEPRHVKVIRNVLHSNITQLGAIYSRFFPACS